MCRAQALLERACVPGGPARQGTMPFTRSALIVAHLRCRLAAGLLPCVVLTQLAAALLEAAAEVYALSGRLVKSYWSPARGANTELAAALLEAAWMSW